MKYFVIGCLVLASLLGIIVILRGIIEEITIIYSHIGILGYALITMSILIIWTIGYIFNKLIED